MKSLKEYPEFLKIISKYSPMDENYADLLLTIEQRIKQPNIIVPILGIQGMGKSTLINALLGEDILPNEADETTCVPVEIRYSDLKKSEVHFKDKNIELLDDDKNKLSHYVDNNFNKGNEKNVSHIVLYRNYPLLMNGLTIVDLPGVGSLTKANEETTKHYIKELCAAVFIISTSPPILRTDANFIKTVWRSINVSYFVQNIWDDNSEDEINDGLVHNQKTLSDISEEINVPMKHDIIPVNVYAAAKGAFTHDSNLLKKSNIEALTNVLSDFTKDYTIKNNEHFKIRILHITSAVIKCIEEKIKQANMSKDELVEELKIKEKSTKKINAEIEDKVLHINKMIDADKIIVEDLAKKIAENNAGLLRADLFHLVDCGVVDGEKLTDAINNLQMEYGNKAAEKSYEKLREIIKELSNELEELDEFFEKENNHSSDYGHFYKKQSFKWEKGVDATFKIGGSIIGVLVGIAITGPYGVAAAIGISLLGSLIGTGTKKLITSKRASNTKRDLEPYITNFETVIKNCIIESFNNIVIEIKNTLDKYIDSRKISLNVLQKEIKDIELNGNVISKNINELREELEYLKKVELMKDE